MLRVLCALSLLAGPFTAQEHDITGPVALEVFALDEQTQPLVQPLNELVLAELKRDLEMTTEPGHMAWVLRIRVEPRLRVVEAFRERLVITYVLLPVTDSFADTTALMMQSSREILNNPESLEDIARLIAPEVRVHLIQLQIKRQRRSEISRGLMCVSRSPADADASAAAPGKSRRTGSTAGVAQRSPRSDRRDRSPWRPRRYRRWARRASATSRCLNCHYAMALSHRGGGATGFPDSTAGMVKLKQPYPRHSSERSINVLSMIIDRLIGVVFLLLGGFTLGRVLSPGSRIMDHPRSQLFSKVIGETGTRVLYIMIGIGLAIGGLGLIGVVKMR